VVFLDLIHFFPSRFSFFLSFIYFVEGNKSLKTWKYKLPIRPALSPPEGFLAFGRAEHGSKPRASSSPLLPSEQSGRGTLARHEEPSTDGPGNLLTCHQCDSSHHRIPTLLFSQKSSLQLSFLLK